MMLRLCDGNWLNQGAGWGLILARFASVNTCRRSITDCSIDIDTIEWLVNLPHVILTEVWGLALACRSHLIDQRSHFQPWIHPPQNIVHHIKKFTAWTSIHLMTKLTTLFRQFSSSDLISNLNISNVILLKLKDKIFIFNLGQLLEARLNDPHHYSCRPGWRVSLHRAHSPTYSQTRHYRHYCSLDTTDRYSMEVNHDYKRRINSHLDLIITQLICCINNHCYNLVTLSSSLPIWIQRPTGPENMKSIPSKQVVF